MELREKPSPYGDLKELVLEPPRCGVCELAPPDVFDPVVEAYKKDVDLTLLRENLKLTPAQRAEKLQDFVNFLSEIQRAGRRMRREES
ncbi:MAG: hypothetical protein AB1705_21050 [Verrucomicrobiota bacterium]